MIYYIQIFCTQISTYIDHMLDDPLLILSDLFIY